VDIIFSAHYIWKESLNSDSHQFHPISTQRTLTSHLIWTHGTQTRPRYMTLEIHVYKNYSEVAFTVADSWYFYLFWGEIFQTGALCFCTIIHR
jgi:pectate lyase